MSRMLDALKKLADEPSRASTTSREQRPRRASHPQLCGDPAVPEPPLRLEIPDLSPAVEAPRTSLFDTLLELSGVREQPPPPAPPPRPQPQPTLAEPPPVASATSTLTTKDLWRQLEELESLTRDPSLAPATPLPAVASLPPAAPAAVPSPVTPQPVTPPPAPALGVREDSPPPRPVTPQFDLPPPRATPTVFERDLLARAAEPACHAALREIADHLRELLREQHEQVAGLAALQPHASHAPLAFALAQVLASQGEKVLLIDGACGLSSLSRGLEYGSRPGFVDASTTPDLLPLIVPTAAAGVWFLPCGRGEPLGLATELAGWRRALAQSNALFSLTLIDLGGIVESLLPAVGRLCDAVFLSAPLGATSLAVQMRLAHLRRHGLRLRGCVGLELDPE